MDEEFRSRFITPNIRLGAAPFHPQLFRELLNGLGTLDSGRPLSPCILASVCCGLRRPDAVPELFALLVQDLAGDKLHDLYLRLREALTVVWTFVGAPQVVVSGLGMAAVLRSKGVSPTYQIRGTVSEADRPTGSKLREEIYRGAGNAKAFDSLAEFFGDFAYAFETFGFGYNIGRRPHDILSLQESELCVMAAVVGLGPTRQARNHVLSCFGLGIPFDQIKAVLDVSGTLATWAGQPFAAEYYQLSELETQAQKNVKAAQ